MTRKVKPQIKTVFKNKNMELYLLLKQTKRSVVNLALPPLNGGSLEITRTDLFKS